MAVNPYDDIDTWLNFAKVARQQGRHLLSIKALMNVGVAGNMLRVNSTTNERSNLGHVRGSTIEDAPFGNVSFFDPIFVGEGRGIDASSNNASKP